MRLKRGVLLGVGVQRHVRPVGFCHTCRGLVGAELPRAALLLCAGLGLELCAGLAQTGESDMLKVCGVYCTGGVQ